MSSRVLGWIEISVVVGYLAFVAAVGLYFSRRQKTTEDYFLAARSVPGWVVGFSLMGTMVGSTTFIGHPGNVIKQDMWALPLHLALPVVMVLVARYLVLFYRRTLRMTAYGYLEKRFGYPARLYGATSFLVSRVVDVSVTFFFLAIPIAFMTGWDVWWVILVVGIVTVLYTLVGGIGAVVWTDVIQGVLLVGGGLTCVAYILWTSEAGPAAITSAAWQGGKFSLGDWRFDWTSDNAWFYLLGGTFWAFKAFTCDQHNVQRYLLARSDREAVRGAYFGAAVCLPIWILFMVLGALLWGHYQLSSEVLPAQVTDDLDNLLPYFIKTQLPAVLVGVILAALMAAAMSCLDSDLNAMATVVVHDFYARLWPASSDRQRLRVGKAVVTLLGIASVVLAQQWIGIEAVIRLSFTLAGILTGGILGLFALGLLFRGTTARAAYAGILACAVFSAWATLTRVDLPPHNAPLLDLGTYNYSLSPYLIGILGHVVLLVVGLLANPLLGGPQPDTTNLTVWDTAADPSRSR